MFLKIHKTIKCCNAAKEIINKTNKQINKQNKPVGWEKIFANNKPIRD